MDEKKKENVGMSNKQVLIVSGSVLLSAILGYVVGRKHMDLVYNLGLTKIFEHNPELEKSFVETTKEVLEEMK